MILQRLAIGLPLVSLKHLAAHCFNAWTSFALMGLFAIVRLSLLDAECLHGDEVFSILVARSTWNGLWSAAAADISHPPLFYALLKLWIELGGESLTWLRILPTLMAFAMLFPFWGLCRTFKLKRSECNLALALGVANAFTIEYTVYVRNFALLQLTSVLSLWAFAHWLTAAGRRSRSLALLFAANLLVVFTHYWGWVVVGCEAAYLLAFARRLLPGFAAAGLGLMLLNIPWIAAVVQAAHSKGTAVSQISWIPRPTWIDPVWFYVSLDGPPFFSHGMALVLLLFGFPVVHWALAALRRGERAETFRFFACFALLPVVLTFVASLIHSQSVWATRSLIVAAVPYWMLVAVAARRLAAPYCILVPIVLVAWAWLSGGIGLSPTRNLDWNSLAAAIAQRELDADVPVKIVAFERYIAEPMGYFMAKQTRLGNCAVELIGPAAREPVNGKHLWIVYRADATQPGAHEPAWLQTLRSRGVSARDPIFIRAGTKCVAAVCVAQ